MQEISSALSITDSMNTDNNVRLLGEIPPDTQISSVQCFVNGKEIPVEDTEGPVNGKTSNSSAELLSSQTLAFGDENVHLAPRNSGTYLVEVKTEPALDGYAICPSESPCVKFHHANNDGLKVSGSILECKLKDSETDSVLLHGTGDLGAKITADSACPEQTTYQKHAVERCSRFGSTNSASPGICKTISEADTSQANSTHAEDSLPSLGVKSELSGYELPGLCENSFISSMEPIVKKPHTRTRNCNGGLAHCSRQRKKRKIAMYAVRVLF